jgi:carbon storage regulator
VLVLSRKVGERILIGDNVVLVVKRVTGQRVTLGIEAPQSVHVVRGELKPFGRQEPEAFDRQPPPAAHAAVIEIDTDPSLMMVAKAR